MDRLKTIALGLFLLPAFSFASDDPCIGLVGMVNPGQAAALSAQRDGRAKPKEFKELDRAEKGEPQVQNNDPQFKARWTSKGNEISKDWHAQAAPQFLAAAMQAQAKMMFPVAAKLMECYQRRTQQSNEDRKAEEKNRAIADQLTQTDTPDEYANAKGYVPSVIHVRARPGQRY